VRAPDRRPLRVDAVREAGRHQLVDDRAPARDHVHGNVPGRLLPGHARRRLVIAQHDQDEIRAAPRAQVAGECGKHVVDGAGVRRVEVLPFRPLGLQRLRDRGVVRLVRQQSRCQSGWYGGTGRNGAWLVIVGKKTKSGRRGCGATSSRSSLASAYWSGMRHQPNSGPR
jgi:hypothetical protein